MGCDLHSYIEKRNADGKWQTLKGKNPDIDWYHELAKDWLERGDQEKAKYYSNNAKDAEEKSLEIYKDWAYNGRNYNLFAVLAGVRDYYGIEPISEPKGLPADVTDMVAEDSDTWGGDGHSHSWLTLAELKAYDQAQEFTHTGWVTDEVYKQWKDGGNPYPSSGNVFGGRVVKLTNIEMDDMLAGKRLQDSEKYYYTEIAWQETIAESTGLDSIIKNLEAASNDESGEDIRIVFWFDN